MKKGLFLLVICAMGFSALAQTHFRDLSFKEAIRTAKKEGKLVFIDFYTTWCGPCKMMSKDVFPQKKVGDYFNAKFVCLKLDAEKEGKELAGRFKVNAYPTFVVVGTDEKVRVQLKGAMDADKFVNKIEEQLNPDYAPDRLTALYKEGNRTQEVVNRYAMYLLEQRKEQEGFKVVNDYYASLTDAQRLEPANSFLFTRYTLEVDDEKAAFMVKNRENFDASLRKEIEEKIAQLYHSELMRYFSGYLWSKGEYKEEKFEALKKDIEKLGLTAPNRYEPAFRLIEGRVKNDDKAFLALCRENFEALSGVCRNALVMNMTRLVQTEDKEVLGELAEFVRSRLSVLPPAAITFAGRMLDGIEERLNR
ncbi:MAG: thioredoxin family protein [Odoribacter sp.]|nr:thioredoxin family protein [Odoribacter sp.]